MDEDGNSVDWFIVYKLPKYSADSGKLYDGTAYLYLDAKNQQYQISPNDVNSTKSAFYRTLIPIYENYKNGSSDGVMARGFYNDQWPNGGYSTSRGHSKGAWAFDSQDGFFLTQSVPKFPNFLEGGFSYPSSGTYYGQDMMCVSLGVDQFDKLGVHFSFTNPWNYNVSIPDQFVDMVPSLYASTVNETHVTDEPFTATETITSLGGVVFTLFSKYKNADLDMVSEQMAPGLKSDLFSQSWQNSGTNLPSDCDDKYCTYTVEKMYFSQFNVSFSTHDDHSKWAMGAPGGGEFKYPSKWVCLGDMNRQESQEGRSGGYTCFEQAAVNQQYTQMTTDLLDCSDDKSAAVQKEQESFNEKELNMKKVRFN
ncbi:plancitoxin-1-like isoform X2 [Symsagittifera roscoffensis]